MNRFYGYTLPQLFANDSFGGWHAGSSAGEFAALSTAGRFICSPTQHYRQLHLA